MTADFFMGEKIGPFTILEDSGLIEGHPAYLVKCRCGNILRKKRSKILRDRSCPLCSQRAKHTPKGVLIVHGLKVER